MTLPFSLFFESFLNFIKTHHPWATPAFTHSSFTPLFISEAVVDLEAHDYTAISRALRAIHHICQLPGFQKNITGTPSYQWQNPGYASGFMGTDFYITQTGPKLIEINTNAAAQLVMAFLAEFHGLSPNVTETESLLHQMLVDQFRHFNRFSTPQYSVIVDAQVDHQKTYFDMALHLALFNRWGWEARIADITDLKWDATQHQLIDTTCNRAIDYVYNRYCDFTLEQPGSLDLRTAAQHSNTCISPHPFDYVTFAQKSQLTSLSNPTFLQNIGAHDDDISALQAVLPETQLASHFTPDVLWANRRHLFFKPQAAFGSRGCYKGDGITRKAFETVLSHNYVVQPLFVPQTCSDPALPTPMKYDIRCYSYDGNIQGWAARLFTGQVTNFRTMGGGFAPVRLGTSS